ncbi:gephyrin-like molybdotransferase receptor GlpR [uncultured Dietzia sp.]|uniref:divisome protein SepX/GlpR n=1 Tax=uncultured Dietzia sp. TaxID=395519 RepID=UPI0025E292F4|nr:gephyrin-like molybdotransferase receptor GlpR [uncultured Dietzia sp.]
MSSSLLIILLVVVWLFVLAPMLIRSRNPIRRTGDALAQTRTLYSGGSGRLVPSRGPATADPVQAEPEESLFGLPTGAGATDAELLDTETWEHTLEQTLRREAAGRRGEAVRRAMEERRSAAAGGGEVSEEITSEIPAVVVSDDDEAAEAVASVDERTASAVAAGTATAEVRSADIRTADARAGDARTVAGRDAADSVRPEVVDGELLERPAARPATGRVDHAEDAAGIDAEAVHLHRGRRRHAEPEVELTDADLDFAERRRGRGAYDPMADRQAAEQRAHARQRTALLLVGLAVVAVIAALLTVPAVWWFAGGTVLLLAAYLTYLRRQVRLEESLRRRRVERMRRARLGVESREDDELSVVPPRLRRPGAVVLEIDDEDPAFDVLDTYDRDLDSGPDHHDRRSTHREPLRRAVG